MLEKGLIDVKEVRVGGRSRRLYTITQKGLAFLKGARELFLNVSQRLAAARGLLLDMLDAEDIPRFVAEGAKHHFTLLHAVIEGSWERLSRQTLQMILEGYECSLLDELRWVRQKVQQIERKEEVKSLA